MLRRRIDGRFATLAVVGCYFATLALVGSTSFWRHAGVPGMSPSFADTRTITAGWECTRKGLAVIAHNPCDPWHRPVNYPRLWMAPAGLGFGQGATVLLGVAAGLSFLAAVFWLARRLTLIEGLVYAFALCSPAVMLAVERGNNDLVVFCIVTIALAAFRRSALGRAVGHGLLLFAAMLKLYPAFAFVVLLRQRRSWALVGIGAVALAFATYFLVTLDNVRPIERVAPQVSAYSYGVGVLADEQGAGGLLGATAREAIFVVLGLAAIAALARLRRRVPVPSSDLSTDAFCAGSAIYCGSYLTFQSFDYRLIFLLLTLPELLRWSRLGSSPLPFPGVAVAIMLATLWLGTLLPVLPAPFDRLWSLPRPVDEYLNWMLFVYLGAGTLVTALSAWRWPLRPHVPARAARAAQ